MPSPAHNLLRPFASLANAEPHRRLRLFQFLTAPFRDIDERAPGARGKSRTARRGEAKPAASAGVFTGNGHAVEAHGGQSRRMEGLGTGRGPVRIPAPGPLGR